MAYGSVCAVTIGSDCPGLSPAVLERALAALDRADLVLGPATDGGYWLIGMRRPAPMLFTEIGYASQQGANQNPWNYFLSDKPDATEQANCFSGFFRAWADVPHERWRGLYIWNWWRNNDKSDKSSAELRLPGFHPFPAHDRDGDLLIGEACAGDEV